MITAAKVETPTPTVDPPGHVPDTVEIAKLAKAMKKAQEALRTHMARTTCIAAEIASVVREAAREADPDLDHRLAVLLARQHVSPDVAGELAHDYAVAWLAFARARRDHLQTAHNDAVDAIEAVVPRRNELSQYLDSLYLDDERRIPAEDEMRALGASVKPHYQRRDLCQQEVGNLEGESRRMFDVHLEAVNDHHVQRFADAYRTQAGGVR